MPRQSEEQLQRLLVASYGNKMERKRLQGLLAQRRYRHRRSVQAKSPPDSVQRSTSIAEKIYEAPNTSNPQSAISTELELILDDNNWLDLDILSDDPASCIPDLSIDSDEGDPSPSSLFESIESSSITSTSNQQQLLLQNQHFSDERYIDSPVLNVVRAHITILTALLKSLNKDPFTGTIWNPFALSPFRSENDGYPIPVGIPKHYHPTKIQLKQPHHPVFDLLPWPQVRDKILLVLSMPPETRPKELQSSAEDAVMKFKYDMMDATEGIRIHGLDAFEAKNWEIGQKVFDGWWWALDMDIVRNSNMHRERRGADVLRLRNNA